MMTGTIMQFPLKTTVCAHPLKVRAPIHNIEVDGDEKTLLYLAEYRAENLELRLEVHILGQAMHLLPLSRLKN